jgi:hypothetical protein
MTEGKTIVIYNRSAKRFKVTHDDKGGTYLEPGSSAELPVAQAGKLLKTYPKELVDMSKMAKPKSTADIEKQITDRDAKIKALTERISELETELKKALEELKKKK